MDIQASDDSPRDRTLAVLIAVLMFITVAPTLAWQEFSSSPENLVVQTAMEMRRGGPWLVPTLQGEPRLAKPPLAAWITAASIRPGTMRELSILDPVVRDQAYQWLALEVRWPALLSACLVILGVFELGREIQDSNLGLIAAAVCASNYFLLRFARYSSTDIQLTLWVTWANVFLCRAALKGSNLSWIGAGAALGLAMMSKGPVCLLQTIVPLLLFAGYRKWLCGGAKAHRSFSVGRLVPPAVGVITFLAIGCSWYIFVLAQNPEARRTWWVELARADATPQSADSFVTYPMMVIYVLPWTVFFLVGCFVAIRDLANRRCSTTVLAFLLLVAPLLIMSFTNREPRYALPMIGPAAIVAAIGIVEHLKSWQIWSSAGKLVGGLHWLTLALIAVVFPVAASTPLLTRPDGRPWFSSGFAIGEAGLGALLVVAGILMFRQRRGGLVAMTFVTMLVAQTVIFKGYSQSPAGKGELRPLADLIAARYPDAITYNAHPTGKRPPTDLGIYLNRTVTWTEAPAALRASTHPLILFMLQNKDEPEPTPPPGWATVDKIRRDKDWWWAFVMPPS